MEILLKGFQCRRCGHQWKPRKEGVPAKCPRCDSPHWQRPRGEGLPAHLAEVFQLYEVPEDQRGEIIDYVQQHPGVVQALREAVPELERVFGKARRRLKLTDQPGEDWIELFGIVLVKVDLEKAVARLQEFNRTWFVERYPSPSDVRTNLSFTVKPEDDYPAV